VRKGVGPAQAPRREGHMRSTSLRSPYPIAARELLRETLLDAALEELRRRAWAEVTMSDVARTAGVSRQTLYKEFGSRDEFASTLTLREADRFLAAIEEAVRAHLDDPAAALAAAFELFLTAAAENPLVLAVFRGGADEFLELVTIRGKPLVEHAVERLAAVMTSGWSGADARECELLSECLVRLAISYVALPKGSSSMTAESVAALFGPYIESMLAF
jgi:AcrR family transcriptional regulator